MDDVTVVMLLIFIGYICMAVAGLIYKEYIEPDGY